LNPQRLNEQQVFNYFMMTWATGTVGKFIVLLLLASGAHGLPKPVIKAKPLGRALQLRGGDVGPFQGKTLAKVFCAFASTDAFCGALIPRTSMRWFGIYIPKDSLSHKYLHGIGASAATIAVATLLAVTGKTSVAQAIGYGFAARMLSMTLMILTNDESKVGMTLPMFGVMWVFLAGIVYSLFAGLGEALTLAKLASVALAIHGLYLYSAPDMILRRTNIAVGPGKHLQ
jgi:hypothetical protein